MSADGLLKTPISGPQRVAAVIPAHNDQETIAQTVRACRAIPGVDLIVVVDDGSDDSTATLGRMAGATVVRHAVARGRASAMETGVKVAAMRDRSDWPRRHILFLDADLGDSAVEASALVDAVSSGADCAIGVARIEDPESLRGLARSAARSVRRQTRWPASDALATNRCLTRAALARVMPLSSSTAVDMSMTLGLLASGANVVEVACDFENTGAAKPKSARWRARGSDILLAAQSARMKRLGKYWPLRLKRVRSGH